MVCVLFSGISESGPSQSPITPPDLMQQGRLDSMELLCSHKKAVTWVQCGQCITWYHCRCVNVLPSTAKVNTFQFVCSLCALCWEMRWNTFQYWCSLNSVCGTGHLGRWGEWSSFCRKNIQVTASLLHLARSHVLTWVILNSGGRKFPSTHSSLPPRGNTQGMFPLTLLRHFCR